MLENHWKRGFGAAIGVVVLCTTAFSADTYDSLIAQVGPALAAKQYSNAVSLAKKAIAMDPARLEGYVGAARGYDALGLFDDEIGTLQQGFAHAPAEKKQLVRDAIAQAQQKMTTGNVSPALPFPGSPAPTQAEIVLWKTIENSQNPQDFQAYLESYPSGTFVPLARQRIGSIEATSRAKLAALPNIAGTWNCQGKMRTKTTDTGLGTTNTEESQVPPFQERFEQDGLKLRAFGKNGEVSESTLDGIERASASDSTLRNTWTIEGQSVVFVTKVGDDKTTLRYTLSPDRQNLNIEYDWDSPGGILRMTSHGSSFCTTVARQK